MVGLVEARASLATARSRLSRLMVLPLKRKLPLRVTATSGGVSETVTLALESPGSFRFRALGATRDEVSMKKISNKKMMSVNDDILNSALTLLRFFSAMSSFDLLVCWLGGKDGLCSQAPGNIHQIDHPFERHPDFCHDCHSSFISVFHFQDLSANRLQ